MIDEAGQSVEVSALVALQHNIRHCILVGDPRQLPATVFIRSDNHRVLERSLFERLEQAGHPVHTLTTQYRMHPSIRKWPSQHFYGNSLTDGFTPTLEPYHTKFPPFQFFHLPSKRAAHAEPVQTWRAGGKQGKRRVPLHPSEQPIEARYDNGSSYCNPAEVTFVADLVSAFHSSKVLTMASRFTAYSENSVNMAQSAVVLKAASVREILA
jgi:superfamily I DNA and/or RNA helicase